MADNLTTTTTVATPPAGTVVAARVVTYSGDSSYVAPVGLVAFAGSDDAKLAFDIGAATPKHLVSAGSTNATPVKSSAGLVVSISIFNNAAYPVFLKFHNNAGTPTPGSGVVYTVGAQAGLPTIVPIPYGLYFSTGIAFSITKLIADADTTAVLANDCVVDLAYN